MAHLEGVLGFAVWEARQQQGRPQPHLVIQDQEGELWTVHVTVGTRPARTNGLYVGNKGRLPDVDLVALIDPRDATVHVITREAACDVGAAVPDPMPQTPLKVAPAAAGGPRGTTMTADPVADAA